MCAQMTNSEALRQLTDKQMGILLGYEVESPPWCIGALCPGRCPLCVEEWLSEDCDEEFFNVTLNDPHLPVIVQARE